MTERETLSGLRVLVAEDFYRLATLLTRYLRDWGSTVVGPSPTVARTLELVDTEAVDLALLDINLQNESVYPAARKLRHRNVPFVFLTGYDDTDLPAEFHGTPYVLKPFEPDDLRRVILRAIEGRDPVK